MNIIILKIRKQITQILHCMQQQRLVVIPMIQCIMIKKEFVLIMNIIIMYLIMKLIFLLKNWIFILRQIIVVFQQIIKLNIHIIIHRLLSIVNSIFLMDGMELLLFDHIKSKVFLVTVVSCCYYYFFFSLVLSVCT